MATISLKKLKEISEKTRETHLIDLGKFVDKTLEGLLLPIKVKSFEEALDLKTNYKLKEEKLTVEYKPFIRMPKSFRDMYSKTDNFRPSITENTFFQICKHSDDEGKIEKNKFRERLFNILIHVDMDYIIEENGLSMWEDAGLKKGDYNGLVELFSSFIKYEKHLDVLDLIIDNLKSGISDETSLLVSIFEYGIKKQLDSIEDETEKRIFIENYNSAISKAQQNIKDVDNSDENK